MNLDPLPEWMYALVAVIGIILAVAIVRRKLKALERFVALLATPERAHTLRALWDEVMRDGVATPAEVHLLVCALKEAAKSLSPKDQRLILGGFMQRSVLGRARYVAMIINRAGIAEGPLPVPVI